jgi:sugar phosphate isomerase/epimerase
MSLPPVGAQLLVFGKKYNINRDADKVLDVVKNAGYVAVEGGASDAASYRQKLDARGLRFGGTHVGLKNLEDVRPLVAYLKTVGGADICNSALMTWDSRSLEDYKTGIRVLNQAGRQLRGEGVHLHYHNHDFEFQKVDGDKTGMDLLMDGLDFSVVDFCIDVAWVTVAGGDAPDFLLRNKDRIGYLHFKDHNGKTWTELGTGRVNWAGIMAVLPKLTKVRWVMIEQDSTEIDPDDSCTQSRKFLKDTFNY